MVRRLISLKEKDKKWLEHYSRMNHVSVSEVIRTAVSNFIEGSQKNTHIVLLRDTAGMGNERTIDGVDYVKKMREEWECVNQKISDQQPTNLSTSRIL